MLPKPKRNRACDSCRKKKARCNGSDMPGGRCATCITYSADCTYNDPLKRAPPKGYVQILEARLAKLEQLIQIHSPPDTPGLPLGSISHDNSMRSDAISEDEVEAQPKLSPLPARAYSKPPDIDPLSPPEEEAVYSDDEFVTVTENGPSEIPVEKALESSRFYGKSSLMVFTNQLFDGRRREAGAFTAKNRRKEFWEVPDWMSPILRSPLVKFEYPNVDLMWHLIDCYFDNLNILLPVLHRPSFVRSIEEGLHHTDHNFGATVLLVCAIGCRYTGDPRVTHEITTSTSCTAWKLFNQIHKLKKVHYLAHSLYEAQIYPLVALFLEGYSPPEIPWLAIGVGLRVMQDRGVHRKVFSETATLETELWKRAFWVLMVLDRSFSTLVGRPCALQDEDFDADLPVLCNDEDLGDFGLKHPVQPPTHMCSFVAVIKLTNILAFALRTLYSTKRSRVALGFIGKQWEQRILVTLDSALNKWIDTVPEHLHRDSKFPQKSRTYQIQFAFLWSQFYEVQLHVHRVFALRNPSVTELTASSMIICKNASKQCIGIIESARDVLLTPMCAHVLIKPMFDSAIFLLLIFWKNGIDYESPEYHAISFVAEMVQLTSKRWRTSLCLRSILRVLRAMVDGPYVGWKPTPDDWNRIGFESILYVDKDGFLSIAENGRGASSELHGNGGYEQDASSRVAEPWGRVHGLADPTENDDRQTFRRVPRMDGRAMYGAIQPGDLPPSEFFASRIGFYGSPATPQSLGFDSRRNGMAGNKGTSGLDRGVGEAHIISDSSSVLPMGLMIYNDLMTDIEGTTRFLGQEFQNSVLFGPASTPSPVPTDRYLSQKPDAQPQNTTYGSWEGALYDNFLEQISRQAT